MNTIPLQFQTTVAFLAESDLWESYPVSDKASSGIRETLHPLPEGFCIFWNVVIHPCSIDGHESLPKIPFFSQQEEVEPGKRDAACSQLLGELARCPFFPQLFHPQVLRQHFAGATHTDRKLSH